ncbi:MAG TPA: cation:dicarboxylase symporter family transporter [Vicinamibacterales bacterium]
MHTPAAGSPVVRGRFPGLTTQIFIGLVAGIVIGWAAPELGVGIQPLADLFLRMIKMIVAPLIFSTLVVGIAGTGDLKTMGRIGLKAMVWFWATTAVALALGLVMVNVFRPGAGLAIPLAGDTSELAALARQQQGGWDILLHMVPTSVVEAMARGDILQVVVFATFFGIALGAIGPAGAPVVTVLDGVAHVMFRVTAYVMRFAPVGVMAAIAATIGDRGLGILLTLGKLVLTMYAALALYVLLVVVGAAVVCRVPFWRFFRAIREPFLIAFTTSSSEAALPKALEVMERFGVPKRIVSFVLPTGYSFNLDGSALYLAAAAIFVAQLAGIELTAGQQIMMLLTLMLTSKGVAGVPRASLVILTAALTTFGLPLEGAAILLGIDQVLDMGRTAVNVMGNCIATVVVARWEGEFDDARMAQF